MAITISGQNNNDKILASDGVLDQISGFNVVGVLTASTFETTGEITANHIDVGSSIQLGNAGIVTATTLIGNVTGNVNSTSNLLLQISGSEKFRVGNGGQLGIGGANYGTSGQVLTSGGSGSAPTWSTIASDKITEGNTEAEVYDNGSDGRFTVKTEGSERLRIDSSGRVLIGHSSNFSGYTLQVSGGDEENSSLSLSRFKANASSSVLEFNKSRNNGIGNNTVVQNNDTVGVIRFKAADGTDYSQVADIQAAIDGTPGNNDTPGRLIFSTTADGAQYTTERLRIGSSGQIGIAGANYGSSGQVLTSQGSSSAPTWTTISGTTINSNSDNRVITGSDTANTLNAESTFTHDPSTGDTQIIHSNNSNVADLLVQHTGSGAAAVARLTLHAGSNANSGCQLGLIVGSHSWYLETPKNAGNLNFMKGGQKFRMTGDGHFGIDDGNLQINGSGHGVDFAQGASTGTAANILDEYEEGTFTPSIIRSSAGYSGSYNYRHGVYTRIGRFVFCYIDVDIASFTGGGGHVGLSGLPFSVNNHGLPGWPHSMHMSRMYLDGDYAAGVDTRTIRFTGTDYGYLMNIDDDQWDYGNYSRVIFSGSFTYMV